MRESSIRDGNVKTVRQYMDTNYKIEKRNTIGDAFVHLWSVEETISVKSALGHLESKAIRLGEPLDRVNPVLRWFLSQV